MFLAASQSSHCRYSSWDTGRKARKWVGPANQDACKHLHDLDKQEELDSKRNALKQVKKDQAALAEMKAQFAGLVLDFELLSENLGLFADTWNAVRCIVLQTSSFCLAD